MCPAAGASAWGLRRRRRRRRKRKAPTRTTARKKARLWRWWRPRHAGRTRRPRRSRARAEEAPRTRRRRDARTAAVTTTAAAEDPERIVPAPLCAGQTAARARDQKIPSRLQVQGTPASPQPAEARTEGEKPAPGQHRQGSVPDLLAGHLPMAVGPRATHVHECYMFGMANLWFDEGEKLEACCAAGKRAQRAQGPRGFQVKRWGCSPGLQGEQGVCLKGFGCGCRVGVRPACEASEGDPLQEQVSASQAAPPRAAFPNAPPCRSLAQRGLAPGAGLASRRPRSAAAGRNPRRPPRRRRSLPGSGDAAARSSST